MKKELLKIDFKPVSSSYVLKRNRFVLKVRIKGRNKFVYMPNPGRLSTILTPGRKILLRKKSSGKYSYEVFAAKMDGFFATLDPKMANFLFANAVEKGLVFKGFSIKQREKTIKGYGRIDFVLTKNKKEHLVEVKSCTHVEKCLAKFPDRQTERGRRHLKHLTSLAKKGKGVHLVVVVQRPDVKRFRPYKEIDPEFSELFWKALKAGVKVHVLSTKFVPKEKKVYLVSDSVMVRK
jgi:sugar fermentation stimulation protein A